MMSVLLEGVPDAELDEEPVCSKYDYKSKDTDNSRNGHSAKTMHTSYGDMEMAVPRGRNGKYQPQLIKKYQNTVTQDMEEKILSMEEVYAAVFMDAIHYHVRSEGQIVKRAVCIAPGIDIYCLQFSFQSTTHFLHFKAA